MKINLRILGFVIAMVLVAGTAGLSYFANGQQNEQGPIQTSAGNAFSLPPITLDQLGSVSTLANARQVVGLIFTYPTYLPSGSILNSTRTATDSVALVYDNQNLVSMSAYASGKIIILIMNDNTTYETPPSNGGALMATTSSRTAVVVNNGVTTTQTIPVSSFSPNYKTVAIAGHPGWGFDPITFSNGIHDSGRVDWWADGRHFSIEAELPLSTLVQIADSMNISSQSSP